MQSSSILEEPRPWPFSRAQLTAGLRKFTGDNRLSVREIKELGLPERRPSIGRIRGLNVVCQTTTGGQKYDLVLKEPQGTTRAGMPGAGLREVSFYLCLGEQVPIEIPQLLAAQPEGDWMLLELLDTGTKSQEWKAWEYLTAVDNLVRLHDRFWGLEEYLGIYSWLGRPLTRDQDIFVQAATYAIEQLRNSSPPTLPLKVPGFLEISQGLITRAGRIAQELKEPPSTLIHGDYWPGNIQFLPGGGMVAYDWQHVSLGQGIIDLVKFYQGSLWELAPLPVSQSDLAARYRQKLIEKNGYTWEDSTWQKQWDYALLWLFLTDWIDLIAKIPAPILETRQAEIASIWLEPVSEAYFRWLKDA